MRVLAHHRGDVLCLQNNFHIAETLVQQVQGPNHLTTTLFFA